MKRIRREDLLRGLVRVLTIGVCALAGSRAAYAQASIAGTVRDSSGAALPGVSVEASSPSLIERSRTASSDAAGQYAIADLRPGTYGVTFKLPGFRTVTRGGIELTGSAIATVNAQMTIGPVAETITVRVDAPLVDVRSTKQAASMTAEIVSTIPTGRSFANLAILVPGMNTWSARSQNDVGGTNNLQNIFTAIHGGRVSDQRIYVDGVNIRNLQSEGHAANFTPDMSSAREVTIDYAAAGAEEALGGVRANYVPREGGNTFQMSVFATGASSAFQSDNVTDDLQRRGLAAPDQLKLTYDVNPTGGGPIVKNAAWFYAAARFQSNQNYVGGIFENRNAGDPGAWTYEPDVARQGVFAITQQSANARVTWQPNPKNRFGGFFEKQWRTWDEGNVNRSPEAFSRFRFPRNQLAVLSWSSPLSGRLLLEARAAHHGESWRNIGGDDLLPNNRSLIPVLEQGGDYPGLMYRAKNGVYAGQSAPAIRVGRASLSYVTGSHALKTGVDLVSGRNTNPNSFNDSGLQYRFNAAVPNQITEFATPYELAWKMTELGAFVQDSWAFKRLTVNTGLRFDSFATSFPEQHLGPGPLVPARDITFPASRWYGLKDVSPRLGIAVDPSGRGTTALRASAGRYLVALPPATGNPIGNLPLSVTRRWDDEDRDYAVDCNIQNPLANGECGMISDLNFGGISPSVTYDPAILRGWNVRPFDWEFSAGVEHRLQRGISMSAAWFRRAYGNFTVQDNLATIASDYDAFSITAPADPRLPGGGGYRVAALYDLNPAKRGQVSNYVTSASRYGTQIERWSGGDVAVSLRLADLTLQGGIAAGRSTADHCSIVAALPEILGTPSANVGGRPIAWSGDQCRVDTGVLTQVKAMGRYKLPVTGLQLAGVFQSAPGTEIQANYVASSAMVQESLGRPLSGAANASVTLIAPGTEYGDRLNQFDVRIARAITAGKTRTILNFDIYNAFNASPVTVANLNYTDDGRRWLQPQGILPARVFKLSAQFDF